MTYYTRFQTPLCEVILAGGEGGLAHLHLCTGQGKRAFGIDPSWARNDAFFEETVRQVRAYAKGERQRFHVPLNPSGTDFQKAVWQELTKIPYGELRTYKQIAKALGNPNACRAVGMAAGKNPIPLIVPCHRMVGADGRLTGFAHGLAMKEKLIALEQRLRRPCRGLNF